MKVLGWVPCSTYKAGFGWRFSSSSSTHCLCVRKLILNHVFAASCSSHQMKVLLIQSDIRIVDQISETQLLIRA